MRHASTHVHAMFPAQLLLDEGTASCSLTRWCAGCYAGLGAQTLRYQRGYPAIKMLATNNEWETSGIKERNKIAADMISIYKRIVGVNREFSSLLSYHYVRVRKYCLEVKADLWKLMKRKYFPSPLTVYN